MENMRGLRHETSIQQVQNWPVNQGSSSSVAGQKRSWSNGNNASTDPPSAHHITSASVQFQRAFSLPDVPARLVPGNIAHLEDNQRSLEYSQRRSAAATPTATLDPELSLQHKTFGLPTQLVRNFASLGIKQIYPWQKSCLKGPGLLNGTKNLVYCAPTGGGKSLVADLLMLKRIMEEPGSKALLVLPYVALVQEKVRWLRSVVQGLRYPEDAATSDQSKRIWRRRADEGTVRVIGFFGGGKIRSTWDDFDIGVCTLEKANALINTSIDDCSISSLKAVVLDELHMIDDGHRGYLLELIGSKLLSLEQPIQIVGMSATLPNLGLLAHWLGAHSYETKYRPVPIEEHLVHEGKIYPTGSTSSTIQTMHQLTSRDVTSGRFSPTRCIEPSTCNEFSDPVLNAVVALAHETALTNFGVLVFAGSRGTCESDARWISRVMPEPHELRQSVVDKRVDLLNDLRSLSTGLDPVLETTVMYGVAFHHAGLTTEERDLIAAAYDSGTLLVCVATASLAAGINLPARRVILHNARMGREIVGPSMLRQMRGRAGRQGKVPVGETYLCCRESDLEQVVELMQADLPEVTSCLNTEAKRVQRAILEVISIRLATSREAIRDYFSHALVSRTCEPDSLESSLDSEITELASMGLIERDAHSNLLPTQLGKAIVAAAIDPDDGIFIYKELSRALKAFVMDGEMHVLYTFTPVQEFGITVNWRVFRNEMEAMDESGLRVLNFLGIKPTTVLRLSQGASMKESTAEEQELARVYRRFYMALQLRDLCNEVPIHMVARKYDVPRGTVQNLSQNCQGFAAGMVKFCEQMGWGVMAAALDHFTDRLMAGARADLLDLAKISFIKSRTARVFWENGFRTVASIANADANELLPVLMQAQPNKLRVKGKDSEGYEEKLLAKATVIVASANKLWLRSSALAAEYED